MEHGGEAVDGRAQALVGSELFTQGAGGPVKEQVVSLLGENVSVPAIYNLTSGMDKELQIVGTDTFPYAVRTPRSMPDGVVR